MAALMKAAGMDTVQLAIEFGTEHMLRNVIKKPLRLSKVAPVVELLHKNGLFVQGFFVMGIPGEREQDRVETAQFIKDVGLDWGSFEPRFAHSRLRTLRYLREEQIHPGRHENRGT